jgi:hypothetical protein
MTDIGTPFEIAPRVYFGPASHTWHAHTMTPFTHVVNCDSVPTSTGPPGRAKRVLFLKSDDDEMFPILERHYPTLRAFIDEALSSDPKAQVYIHCHAGVNRSAALACAYACEVLGEPAAALVDHVRRATRRLILTNEAFYRALCQHFPHK